MPLTFQPSAGGVPLASSPPMPETVQPSAGTSGEAARADHSHKRPTSAGEGTLAANGEVTLTFTRSFTEKPAITFQYEELADAQPVTLRVKSWVRAGPGDSGDYLGCVVKGTRPAMTVLQVVGITVAGGTPTGGVVTGLAFTYIAVMKTAPTP